MGTMNLRKVGWLLFGTLGLLVGLLSLNSLVETNNEGYYQIKQAALSGDMTVRTLPGTYLQLFGSIFTYQVSDMYYFSKHDEGGTSWEADPIRVRFNDGGTADITGSLKFRLSSTEKDQLLLHRDFKSYLAVKQDLIRQVVTEALMQTSSLMRAEESYSTRRAEFVSLAEDQVKYGIYDTISEEHHEKDADGNVFIETDVNVRTDATGKKIIKKVSPFLSYHIEVIQFVIKDLDFDATIDALISKKKEAEQQKVVAKANAERAKQDAITEREQGAARIAKAKADEDVVKIQAVTQAAKEYEVSVFARKRADEEAKAKILQGEAEARVSKLKVAAGLTPLEAAQIRMQTAIGVAEKLSSVKFPSLMVIGGGNGTGGHALNPFDAVGLESFMRLSEKMSGSKE
jgi:hypothetical protein